MNHRTVAALMTSAPADPVGRCVWEHRALRMMCGMLERIADGLPDAAPNALAAFASRMLLRQAADHASFEDDLLFPALSAAQPPAHLRAAMALASSEHAHDDGARIELAEALSDLAATGRAANPAALGFMLRSYFTTQRRHMDWEETALFAAARDLLDAKARAALSAAIAERDAQGRMMRFSSADLAFLLEHGAA